MVWRIRMVEPVDVVTWLPVDADRTKGSCCSASQVTGLSQAGGLIVEQDVGGREYRAEECQDLIEGLPLSATARHHVLYHQTRMSHPAQLLELMFACMG